MTVKEYLNQYRVARLRIARCRERLEQIAASLDGTGGNADGMPRAGTIPKPTEANAVRLADTRARLERMIIDAELIRQQIADEIEHVEGVPFQELLYARDVQCLDWRGVTIRVSARRGRPYDEVYVRGRMHSDALRAFQNMRDREKIQD